MSIRSLQKKLDRFLYFRKVSREDRRAVTGDFRAMATDKNIARALYRDMRKGARKRYKKDMFKIIPYALCLVAMIPSLELIFFSLLSLFGYDKSTLYIAYSGFLENLDANGYGIILEALRYFSMGMVAFPFVFIPAGILIRKIRIGNYGRNIATHLLQILMLMISLALILLDYATHIYANPF